MRLIAPYCMYISFINTCLIGVLVLYVTTNNTNMTCVEPPARGQPPNKGQKSGSRSVLYSEVPLYTIIMLAGAGLGLYMCVIIMDY